MILRKWVSNGYLRIPGVLRLYNSPAVVWELCCGRLSLLTKLVGLNMLKPKPITRTTTSIETDNYTTNLLKGNKKKLDTPRFLIIIKDKGNFSRDSMIMINRIICEYASRPDLIRKVKEGLLVKTASADQTERLLETKVLGQWQVRVQIHKVLNYSRGVITCEDLRDCSIEEIIEELLEQGVVNAERIQGRRKCTLYDTSSVILTFNRLTLPREVKVGFWNLPVKFYNPNPKKFFEC